MHYLPSMRQSLHVICFVFFHAFCAIICERIYTYTLVFLTLCMIYGFYPFIVKNLLIIVNNSHNHCFVTLFFIYIYIYCICWEKPTLFPDIPQKALSQNKLALIDHICELNLEVVDQVGCHIMSCIFFFSCFDNDVMYFHCVNSA